jgi:iron(III) transport system substrate-binding protein
MEYLTAPERQRVFAASNFEFPVSGAARPAPEVRAWGEFKADPIDVARAGERQADAVRLMDRVGWD